MKIRSVVFTAFLMVISAKSFAGHVEIAQWIPWSIISDELKKIPTQFQTSQGATTLQFGEWAPIIPGSQFQVSGTLSDLQISQSGAQAQVSNISARLAFDGLKIDQTIIREINGNQIKVRVQADCQPFEIQIYPFSIAARASFQKQGQMWAPQLTNLELQIPIESWSVSPLVCQGVSGFDQSLLRLIQVGLSQPETFEDTLKNWIAPKISEAWTSSWNKLLNENWQSLQIKSLSDPMENGFYLKGKINISKSSEVLLPSLLQAPENLSAPQLILSTEGFTSLVEDNIKSVSLQNYNLQQISAFQKIMRNRFIQLFVWPDLLHFSRKTPFYLSTIPADTKMSLQSKGMGLWDMSMQTRGYVQVDRKGKTWNYLNWGIGMSAQLQTQIKDSQLVLTTTQSKSNINWAFDPAYVQAFRPSGSIPKSVLEEAGKALFENRTVQKELPVLHLQGKQWKLDGWKQNGSLILMDWKN